LANLAGLGRSGSRRRGGRSRRRVQVAEEEEDAFVGESGRLQLREQGGEVADVAVVLFVLLDGLGDAPAGGSAQAALRVPMASRRRGNREGIGGKRRRREGIRVRGDAVLLKKAGGELYGATSGDSGGDRRWQREEAVAVHLSSGDDEQEK
jgi:hypothetical protein